MLSSAVLAATFYSCCTNNSPPPRKPGDGIRVSSMAVHSCMIKAIGTPQAFSERRGRSWRSFEMPIEYGKRREGVRLLAAPIPTNTLTQCIAHYKFAIEQ